MGVNVTPVYTLKCWWRLSRCENRWFNNHKRTTMQSEMQAFEQGFYLNELWVRVAFLHRVHIWLLPHMSLQADCNLHLWTALLCWNVPEPVQRFPQRCYLRAITGIQYWLLAFPLHTDISPDSQDISIMLCTADDQIYIIFTILL